MHARGGHSHVRSAAVAVALAAPAGQAVETTCIQVEQKGNNSF